MTLLKKHIEWLPAIIIILILGGSLPYKFTGAAMPVHIFNTVGAYLGLDFFKTYGAFIIGTVELACCILLLIPKARVYGAILTLGVMAGAIFFHLFSPLGTTVVYVDNGVTEADTSLFITAIIAFLSALWIFLRRIKEVPILGKRRTSDDTES